MSWASFFSASGRIVCAERRGATQETAISITISRTFLVGIMAAFFHGGRIGCNLNGLEIHGDRLSTGAEIVIWDSCTKYDSEIPPFRCTLRHSARAVKR